MVTDKLDVLCAPETRHSISSAAAALVRIGRLGSMEADGTYELHPKIFAPSSALSLVFAQRGRQNKAR